MMAQKDLQKAFDPILRNFSGNHPIAITIPLFGGTAIIIVIAVVLFKRRMIDSHSLILGFWMLMWFGSVILNTWDFPKLSVLLIYFHIVSSIFGLAYWIRLGVTDYRITNELPPMSLLFEIVAWVFMFVLSCIEVLLWALRGDKQYRQVSHWYPVAFAFISMVENYWNKGKEIRAKRFRSQLVRLVESGFRDFIWTYKEDLQKCDVNEFNRKFYEFTTVFDVLVAQKREAIRRAQYINDSTKGELALKPQGNAKRRSSEDAWVGARRRIFRRLPESANTPGNRRDGWQLIPSDSGVQIPRCWWRWGRMDLRRRLGVVGRLVAVCGGRSRLGSGMDGGCCDMTFPSSISGRLVICASRFTADFRLWEAYLRLENRDLELELRWRIFGKVEAEE
ncbi:unnamed protein product [Cuscuta campestris]|uniref:Uncharacterized protein n=1 Tax=Cuscuta campestris TaxID=132261 RepID=A0A484KP54_9ASTE|nr:unnamed protein product [Cuscuta campestris]